MRCALAAVGFVNEDSLHNKNVIITIMKKYAEKADIVIFGEAFLQGFYGANFESEHDEKLAISKDDAIIREIAAIAKECEIAVSFGFIEKEEEIFYSSQITIDATGKMIDLYRRVSAGWKEEIAGERYQEGKSFQTFDFMGKKMIVGLCGDLWFEENVDAINRMRPDVVFWPVYTDYSAGEWNETIKYEYAKQAGKINAKILYVNAVCQDKEGDEIAKGGTALFEKGVIASEIPSGGEGILLVEM